MSADLSEAPIIELVAEVRWTPDPQASGQLRLPVHGGQTLITDPSNELEEFYMRFGGLVYAQKYQKAERLSPPGMPAMLHGPVYRFKTMEPSPTSLYQVGPGLFTANAIPPYDSWADFRTVVRGGVEAMLIARPERERNRPIESISLRYIDAFGPRLTQGRDVATFLREILHMPITVPDALSRYSADPAAIKPHVQFQLQLSDLSMMNVSVGEGIANDKLAIIMDTSITRVEKTMPNIEPMMEAFDSAHRIIHDSFVALTKPIAHLMPVKARVAS